VIVVFQSRRSRRFVFALLASSVVAKHAIAQEPSAATLQKTPPSLTQAVIAPGFNSSAQIKVPVGTHLPLFLRNGINTSTAKAGDSVYFETAYPLAVNNKMAIPMGSFVRGEIVEAKRPGRIRGRGEFRIALNQLTFPNGYTIELQATPSSVDGDGQEGVTPEGKVKGPSGVGKDVGTALLITAVGGPVGGYAGLLAGSTGRGSLAIGHGVGAAAGLMVVLLTRGPEAELPRGTTMDVVFDRPLVLDAASLPANAGAGVDPQPRTVPMPVDSRRERREWQKKRMRQSMLPSLFLLHF
jgi:type IV secretion system protein VirB10